MKHNVEQVAAWIITRNSKNPNLSKEVKEIAKTNCQNMVIMYKQNRYNSRTAMNYIVNSVPNAKQILHDYETYKRTGVVV